MAQVFSAACTCAGGRAIKSSKSFMTLSFGLGYILRNVIFFGSMVLEQSESVTIANQDRNVTLQTRSVKLPRSS